MVTCEDARPRDSASLVFCLLFAMWFASGIVMHFMPFPARDEKPLATGLDMSRASTDQIG
jgi:hypothetical protein